MFDTDVDVKCEQGFTPKKLIESAETVALQCIPKIQGKSTERLNHHITYVWSYSTSDRKREQGGHILAEIKFPVFSLSFPCVT